MIRWIEFKISNGHIPKFNFTAFRVKMLQFEGKELQNTVQCCRRRLNAAQVKRPQKYSILQYSVENLMLYRYCILLHLDKMRKECCEMRRPSAKHELLHKCCKLRLTVEIRTHGLEHCWLQRTFFSGISHLIIFFPQFFGLTAFSPFALDNLPGWSFLVSHCCTV